MGTSASGSTPYSVVDGDAVDVTEEAVITFNPTIEGLGYYAETGNLDYTGAILAHDATTTATATYQGATATATVTVKATLSQLEPTEEPQPNP